MYGWWTCKAVDRERSGFPTVILRVRNQNFSYRTPKNKPVVQTFTIWMGHKADDCVWIGAISRCVRERLLAFQFATSCWTRVCSGNSKDLNYIFLGAPHFYSSQGPHTIQLNGIQSQYSDYRAITWLQPLSSFLATQISFFHQPDFPSGLCLNNWSKFK